MPVLRSLKLVKFPVKFCYVSHVKNLFHIFEPKFKEG